MGMEDYQVNGMGYEKPASEHRLDYLRQVSCGHLPAGFPQVAILGAVCDTCSSCNRGYNMGGITFHDATATETHIIMLPMICRYSEV